MKKLRTILLYIALAPFFAVMTLIMVLTRAYDKLERENREG